MALFRLRNLYGKFPEFLEVMAVVRNIYGEDFMEIFERGFTNIENTFDDESGELTVVTKYRSIMRINGIGSVSIFISFCYYYK